MLQKLVVLADADLLAAPDDAGMTRAALLTGLLTHPYIEMLRYRDEGLAAEQPGDREPPKGWACLLPPDGEQWRTLIYAHGSERRTYTGVSTEVAAYARETQAPARTDLPPDVAADRRERDALAADVATAVEADLFITERPYLFGTKRIHVPAVTLCQTPEALAMIGLYLRSQGEFILWRRLSAFTQFPRVPSFDAQVTGHLRDRLAGLPDQLDRALPEVRIELPACLCHRRPP